MNIIDRIYKAMDPDPKFVIAIKNPQGGTPIRLMTNSFDHLKANIDRFRTEDILYIAMRYGVFYKKIKAVAIYSPGLEGVYRGKKEALAELATIIMQYAQSRK